MTIALEHIQEGDWAALNRAVDLLRSLVLDTGGQSLGIRVGTTTLTFTASNVSAHKTVSHGLGRTPAIVWVGDFFNTGVIAVHGFPVSGTTGSSSFDAVGATYASSVFTGTATVGWVVVG